MRKAVIYIYVCGQVGTPFMLCRFSVIYFFPPAKFEQTITHQRVLLQRESVIDGTTVQ
jgi:hypothetical protein